MLIDAIHPEETRVVTCTEDRIYDFDSETSTKKQLKGNIYLAKVSRVEPSLQAVFVDYGGNRHGFLPFSEIHPDYYRIPVEDSDEETTDEASPASEEGDESVDEKSDENESVTTINNNEDMFEEIPQRKRRLYDRYKIQEVIQKRQILLVQVVKEERGNKGAALTTYLSIPGRYCVLMPNTSESGGISRKITNINTRKRLRKLLDSLTIPEGVSVIIRTAGMERTKAEVKRDYDYLMRLWSKIRQLTLDSVAPNLIYEEDDLIKRSIRDLYTRDIEEILIEGEEAYKSAKNLMKLLMPSHAKRVQRYKDELVPLFHRYHIERQLLEIHQTSVQLKSGGTIVINPTEALVSVDVNSARSTKLRHIDDTALTTNVEAAEEVARQLRLRDLGGLVVIDFIDMQDEKHNYQVEKKLRESLRSDRARIQLGRISSFGLLEMSRQRLRPSIHEISSHECPHCEGTGRLRSRESSSLVVLRAIEEMGYKNQGKCLTVEIVPEVAFYLLNEKRQFLGQIEERYDILVRIKPNENFKIADFEMYVSSKEVTDDEEMQQVQQKQDDGKSKQRRGRNKPRGKQQTKQRQQDNKSKQDDGQQQEDQKKKRPQKKRNWKNKNQRHKQKGQVSEDQAEETNLEAAEGQAGDVDGSQKTPDQEKSQDKKRRRPQRRRKPARQKQEGDSDNRQDEVSNADAVENSSEQTSDAEKETKKRPQRRGRRPVRKKQDAQQEAPAENIQAERSEEKPTGKKESSDKKPNVRRGRKPKAKSEEQKDNVVQDLEPANAKPKRKPRAKPKPKAEQPADEPNGNVAAAAEEAPKKPRKKRQGWWQRINNLV